MGSDIEATVDTHAGSQACAGAGCLICIEHELDELRTMMTEIRTYLVDTRTDINHSRQVIDKVAAEVMPTLDGLMKSPMIKMLMPKVK